ncbi:MAG: HEAT repeat domain-containing protein, partial [Deltaproteobacteria bacterium]|nr:HEAT repeat domain-containing protein [Deltaproteobacteria bacterium]
MAYEALGKYDDKSLIPVFINVLKTEPINKGNSKLIRNAAVQALIKFGYQPIFKGDTISVEGY